MPNGEVVPQAFWNCLEERTGEDIAEVVVGFSQISRDATRKLLNWYNSLSQESKAVLGALSALGGFALNNTLRKAAFTLGIVEIGAPLIALLLGLAAGVGWGSTIDAFFQCENLL